MHTKTFLLAGLLLLSSCKARQEPTSRASAEPRKRADFDLEWLPARDAKDPEPRKVALGRKLFNDKRLSDDGTVSCVSCHLRERGYANGIPVAVLATRPPSEVNTPTLLNVAFNYRYNWDGRFDTLENQLDALIANPGVMRASWASVVSRLTADAGYVREFGQVYEEGITSKTVPNAIISYLRSLSTPGARFDVWRQGKGSLSEAENAGFVLFQSYGCASCHQGRNVGGNILQRFGIMEDYFAGRAVSQADRGLGRRTNDPEDEHVFRVPSLRNVELTAPYFHDGSAPTLDDAVRVMGRVQLGRELSTVERSQIVAFLRTLTGDMNDEALR